MSKRSRRRLSPSSELVDAVREFVARIGDEFGLSEVDAVKLVALAVARVAGEVTTASIASELRGLLGYSQ